MRNFLRPKPAYTGEQLAKMETVQTADLSPVRATETAVTLANDRGVDLSLVTGTGVDGRITKGDVEAFLQNQQ